MLGRDPTEHSLEACIQSLMLCGTLIVCCINLKAELDLSTRPFVMPALCQVEREAKKAQLLCNEPTHPDHQCTACCIHCFRCLLTDQHFHCTLLQVVLQALQLHVCTSQLHAS